MVGLCGKGEIDGVVFELGSPNGFSGTFLMVSVRRMPVITRTFERVCFVQGRGAVAVPGDVGEEHPTMEKGTCG